MNYNKQGTWVPRMKLSRLTSPILKKVYQRMRSQHLMTRQSFLFLMLMTAWLLKMMVLLRLLGLEDEEEERAAAVETEVQDGKRSKNCEEVISNMISKRKRCMRWSQGMRSKRSKRYKRSCRRSKKL